MREESDSHPEIEQQRPTRSARSIKRAQLDEDHGRSHLARTRPVEATEPALEHQLTLVERRSKGRSERTRAFGGERQRVTVGRQQHGRTTGETT